MKTCSIAGCPAVVKGGGLCSKHLMRQRRHGDPSIVNRPGPRPQPAKAKPVNEALAIAKASDGPLDSSQVRILQALLNARRELTRKQLTEAVGIGNKHSKKWLDALWALARKKPPLIVIGNYEGDRKSYHSITAKGREVLKKAIEAAENSAKTE